MWNRAASELYIFNSEFTNNVAHGRGGAIYAHGHVDISSSTISGNTADSGGGVFGQSRVHITDQSYLQGNVATSKGGAVHVSGDELTIRAGTILDGNRSDGDGGAVFILDGVLQMDDGTVRYSSATADGGGILARNTTVEVTNSTISGNSTCEDGGGLHVEDGDLTILDSTIGSNSAAACYTNPAGPKRGGGIFFRNGSLQISNYARVSSNYALAGGGLYAAQATATITGSMLSLNTACMEAVAPSWMMWT